MGVFAVIILVAVAAGAWMFLRCRNGQAPTIDAIRRAGRALGGTVTRAPDGTFQLDALVAGQSVHLGYQTIFQCGYRQELFAEVDLADHNSQLDVHPREATPHPEHGGNLEDTPSGDLPFDQAYHVLSSSEQPVPGIIPAEARQLMLETGPVIVRVSEGRLRVRRSDSVIDAPTILNVARIAGLSARAFA